MPYKDKEKANEKAREYSRIRENRRKNAGLCYDCGTPASLGYSRCANCTAIRNFRAKKYRQTHKKKIIEYDRMLRRRRKDEDRCVRCGKPLMRDETDVSGSQCIACLSIMHLPLKSLRGVE